ncbi:MAG: hypothetical protein K2K21_16745 [Lachnospiraceae bacterium]|nr:hypothetical protein [Lachnospiraceae bacterium]
MKHRMISIYTIFLILTLTACGIGQDSVEKNETENSDIESDEQSVEQTPEQTITEMPETESETEFKEPISRTIEQSGLTAFYADSDEETEPFGLTLVSESGNNISNPDDWFAENQLYLPMINGPLAESALQIYKEPDIDYDYWEGFADTIFFDENYVYEWSPTDICVYDKETMELLYYVQTASAASDTWYIMGNCAYVRDGILYTCNIFNGYATPNSCYLMAYDLEEGELLWRSEDQTFNSMNFIVKGDVIICGYGFTAEDDYIYQISMRTGKTISKTAVAKMPDILVEQDGKLYAHTYSYDYVFEIEEK